jgi:ribosome biogenesis protein YTM1
MSNGVQIRARFVTDHEEFRISDAPFAIPAKLGRFGLSEVINHLMGNEEQSQAQSFDFCIQDILVRTPLSKFVVANNLSTEDVLTIQYFPASSMADEQETIESPAWVGCLDNGANTSGLVSAGCYDGSIQIIDPNTNSELCKMQAHPDPVRAVISWSSANETILATASKDQMLKCWSVKQGKGVSADVAQIAT